MAAENEIKEQQAAGQKFDWKKLISHKWVVRNIPFFLFLTALAVLYIYNGHYTDKQVLKISKTEKKTKELEQSVRLSKEIVKEGTQTNRRNIAGEIIKLITR